MKKTYTLGSKNPKKEIDITLTKKHIFYGFLIVLLVGFAIVKTVDNPFKLNKEYKVQCHNGSKELIEYNKTIYCGEYYETIKDSFSPETYGIVENIILNKGE